MSVATPSTPAPVKPKKKIRWGLIIIICAFLALVSARTYKAYFYNPRSDGSINPDINVPEETNSNSIAANQNTNKSTSSKKSSGAVNTDPVPTATDSSQTASFNMVEFFAETATSYQTYEGTTQRWTKGTVYIGGKESDYAPIYSECLNQIISDFNSASSSVKLERNAALADIKIYFLSDQETEQYSGSDTGGSAGSQVDSSGEITSADIYLKKSYNPIDSMKCYLIKHETFHTLGFSHSDQARESVMGMPSSGANQNNWLEEVDKRAIRMLYANGLPLKQSAAQIRAYFGSHTY